MMSRRPLLHSTNSVDDRPIFGVPALNIANQAALALYATGRTAGLVVDSGVWGDEFPFTRDPQAGGRRGNWISACPPSSTSCRSSSGSRASSLRLWSSPHLGRIIKNIVKTMCYFSQDHQLELGAPSSPRGVPETYTLPDGGVIKFQHRKHQVLGS